MKNNTVIEDILNWFKLAKPTPTYQDKMTQIGCHFEEVDEMVKAILPYNMACEYQSNLELSIDYKESPPEETDSFAEEYFKEVIDKEELLDSLCDQIVTALGVGYVLGFDMQGALAEVSRSNNSKIVDGKFIYDKNGKMGKPEGHYTPPNLESFIGGKGE